MQFEMFSPRVSGLKFLGTAQSTPISAPISLRISKLRLHFAIYLVAEKS